MSILGDTLIRFGYDPKLEEAIGDEYSKGNDEDAVWGVCLLVAFEGNLGSPNKLTDAEGNELIDRIIAELEEKRRGERK